MSEQHYSVSNEARAIVGDHVEVLDLAGQEGTLVPEVILASQLKPSPRASSTAGGSAHLAVYARLHDADEMAAVADLLGRLDTFFQEHPRSVGSADVMLLLPRLCGWNTGDAVPGASSDTAANFGRFDEELERRSGSRPILRLRVWLLDVRTQGGETHSPKDVGALLQACRPGDFRQALPNHAGNYLTFGGRIAVFPRTEILSHLADQYALRVLSHEERWLGEAYAPPYATVGQLCAEFLDDVVRPILDRIDLGEGGHPLVERPPSPQFSPSASLSVTQAAVDEEVDALKKRRNAVETQLARNFEALSGELRQRFQQRVRELADTPPGRTLLARAFIDVMEYGVSDITAGSQNAWAGSRRLRDAYSGSIAFLDELTDFETEKRDALRSQEEDLRARSEQIARLERQHERECEVGGDEDSPKVAALQTAIDETRRDIEEVKSSVTALQAEVYAQDLRFDPANTRELLRAVELSDTEAVAEAYDSLSSSKQSLDDALIALRAAESETQAFVRKVLKRVLIAVAGLLAAGVAGTLLIPLLFSAVPVVGAPLFGFLGTAVGATWARVWGVASLVSLFVLALTQIREYVRHVRQIDVRQRESESAEGLCRARMREYWDVSVTKTFRASEMKKHLSLLALERELTERFDSERGLLLRFEEIVRDLREEYEMRIAEFRLESTATKFVVVAADYVEELLERNSKAFDSGASRFFTAGSPGDEGAPAQRHNLSAYLDSYGTNDSVQDLMDDIREDCLAEVAWEVIDATVLDAARTVDSTLTELQDVATGLSPLLPLSDRGEHNSVTVALTPDTQALEGVFSALPRKPTVVEHDDDERIVLIRVVYDIDREDIEAIL